MAIAAPVLLYGASTVTGLPERIGRWAVLPYHLLILGEPGTGKSVLAREIHGLSGRRGPFLECSLAQVPEQLQDSEIRGSVRGAYTGAENRAGPFEAATHGTVFLDELGCARKPAQGTLLHIVETRSVARVGETLHRRLDFRLIAATNADLVAMVAAGEFRADLLARLGYYVVRLLPLRERRADILPLVALHLEGEATRCGRRAPALSAGVRRLLERAPWPGNIRDLRSVCEYLAGNAGDEAGIRDLPAEFLGTMGVSAERWAESPAERARRVVKECGGNRSAAARKLGISRGHLYRLISP